MTPIYHITHVGNLSRILAEGGLWSDTERAKRGLNPVAIAHQRLKTHRARTRVGGTQPVAAGGVLADYVPFFFANRSPMLGAIHTGQVEGYAGTQREIVYLVSSVEHAMQLNRPWCFTDGHAVEAITKFFDSLDELTKVDWKVIAHWSWKNRPDDLDRKRRKQAEFLVHEFFPCSALERLAVIDQAMATRIKKLLADAGAGLVVSLEPKWFY